MVDLESGTTPRTCLPSNGFLQCLFSFLRETVVAQIEGMSEEVDFIRPLAQVDGFHRIDTVAPVPAIQKTVIEMIRRTPDLIFRIALSCRHALGMDIQPTEPPAQHFRRAVGVDRVNGHIAGAVIHHAIAIFCLPIAGRLQQVKEFLSLDCQLGNNGTGVKELLLTRAGWVERKIILLRQRQSLLD